MGHEILDLPGAMARLGGDELLYADMVQFLREDCPTLLNELHTGIASKTPSVVQRAAHSLKGLIANCGGVRAAEVAQRIENAGAGGDLSDAAHLIEPLRREIDDLMQALHGIRSRYSAPSTHAR